MVSNGPHNFTRWNFYEQQVATEIGVKSSFLIPTPQNSLFQGNRQECPIPAETKWDAAWRVSLHSHELCQREINALDNYGDMITNFVNEKSMILNQGQKPSVGRHGHGMLFAAADMLHIFWFAR
jgi:hypothetical protein